MLRSKTTNRLEREFLGYYTVDDDVPAIEQKRLDVTNAGFTLFFFFFSVGRGRGIIAKGGKDIYPKTKGSSMVWYDGAAFSTFIK